MVEFGMKSFGRQFPVQAQSVGPRSTRPLAEFTEKLSFPIPICAQLFLPQQWRSSASVIAQVWLTPTVTDATPCPRSISTGIFEILPPSESNEVPVVMSPSCPTLLEPQQNRLLSSNIAHAF